MARVAAVVDVHVARRNKPMQAPIMQILIWHKQQPVLQPRCLETSFDSNIERINMVNKHHIRVRVVRQHFHNHVKIIHLEPIWIGNVG